VQAGLKENGHPECKLLYTDSPHGMLCGCSGRMSSHCV
jgi:hypothetical protein